MLEILWPITCSVTDFVKYTRHILAWSYKKHMFFWQSQCINYALQLNGWFIQIEPLMGILSIHCTALCNFVLVLLSWYVLHSKSAVRNYSKSWYSSCFGNIKKLPKYPLLGPKIDYENEFIVLYRILFINIVFVTG